MSCDLFGFFCDPLSTEYAIEAHHCITDDQCTIYEGVVHPSSIWSFNVIAQDGKTTREIKTDIDILGQKVYFYIEDHSPLEVSSHDCTIVDNSLYINKNNPGDTITIIIRKLK